MLSEMREESSLRDLPSSELTAKIIVEAAAQKDPVAVEALDYTAKILALGIVNAVSFSSPEAIFLFGGLAQAGELLFAPIREYVDQNIQPIFKGTVKILASGVAENNAAVAGAAALAWNEMKKS
jgi:glucokinase